MCVKHESSTQCGPIYRKYLFQNPNDHFLNNDIWHTALCKTIDTLERNIQTRDQLNALCEKLVQSIINEMDTYLKFRDINNTMKKKYKLSKPYWNEQLTSAWESMTQCEKDYVICFTMLVIVYTNF